MIYLIKQLYNSIQLHLGIKRFLFNFFWKIKYAIDNNILYPLHTAMDTYFFKSEIFHYGGEYRWGDEKSQNLDIRNKNYGYGLMHYTMVKNFRPKRILCVGSMYGYIPYMLAKACMENHTGHVDFIDAAFDLYDEKYKTSHYFGQGFWKKTNGKQHFSYLLDPATISVHVMTLEDYLKSHHHTYAYVYLDGDHSYAGLIRDIKLVWPSIRQGGLLCLHDIEFDFKKSLNNVDADFRKKVQFVTFGVEQIWNKFEKMQYKMPILNGYSGIGYIYKQKKDSTRLPTFLRHV